MDQETPRLSHGGALALLSETITAILAILDEAGDSAHVRALRARARSYERIIAMWATVPPTDAQRETTFDLVTELHVNAAEARLDVARRNSSAPGGAGAAGVTPAVRSRRGGPPDER